MHSLRGAWRRFPSAHRHPSCFRLPHLPLNPYHPIRWSSSSRPSNLSSTIPLDTADTSVTTTATTTTTTPPIDMDDKVKQHYLADSPPSVVRLEIKTHFDNLKDAKLRKYAHYMSRFGANSLSERPRLGEANMSNLSLAPLLQELESHFGRFLQSQNPSMTSSLNSIGPAMETGMILLGDRMSAMSIFATSWNMPRSFSATVATIRALATLSLSPVCPLRPFKL